jgi:hypothetical protein
MKNKDQLLLEKAYDQILIDEKINWKGALTGVVLTAATLLGVGNAKADSINQPSAIEQNRKLTAEDLLPRKEFDEVLSLMRSCIAKGDLVSAKKILLVVEEACTDAAGNDNIINSKEIEKIGDMHAEALQIFNRAYLGVISSGVKAVGDATRSSLAK